MALNMILKKKNIGRKKKMNKNVSFRSEIEQKKKRKNNVTVMIVSATI